MMDTVQKPISSDKMSALNEERSQTENYRRNKFAQTFKYPQDFIYGH
jgi:hypothetical protein